jgi:hypothetical protein
MDGMAELPDQVRRRLAEVFGDTLPEVTRDELEDEPRPVDRERDEEWYRRDRPPHHDQD